MRGRRGAGAGARALAQRRPHRRAARPRGGPGARWLALLALLTQLCGLAHALLVRHARCEHGELVHVGALVSAAHAGHSAHAAALAAAAPQLADDEASGPAGDRLAAQDARRHVDDDHCDAFALRGQLGAPLHRVAEATLLEVLCLDALRPSPEVRPIPLLILAPKSSPPAA
ncbi:hypothetical protein [Sorangium sp. So ce388]|uniref:hypothetical protein n=1 Tax=Sorangium sp. So ce388 TaxID=3133309 RepID=UPI003F5B3B0C